MTLELAALLVGLPLLLALAWTDARWRLGRWSRERRGRRRRGWLHVGSAHQPGDQPEIDRERPPESVFEDFRELHGQAPGEEQTCWRSPLT